MLKPILRFLIGENNLRFYEETDWQQAIAPFCQAQLTYPDYYSSQNFHGITGGYLNPIAPITYDPVAAIASPPSETWIRQQLIAKVQGQPAKILDLGCGTGSTTLMLKQAFPQAQVWGLDLSPYMLVLADFKAQQAGLKIHWLHGLAETTGLNSANFDLVTCAFLFHETPPDVAELILQEAFRLLKPGGQLLILDGNQRRLRRANWLITLFREPYSKAYAAHSLETWLQTAGFRAVQNRAIGWISQLTSGVK
ncbi:MAG: class I SAM-dependent methyltransferase [Elainellaceae cyanobacterium]